MLSLRAPLRRIVDDSSSIDMKLPTMCDGGKPIAEPMRAPVNKRIPVIDAFRGICILSVLIFHYLVRFAPPFLPDNLYGYTNAYPAWLEVLQLGVEVFFVISGIVIALTLTECDNAFEFSVKRFARLYPGYIAAATVTFALMTLFGPAVLKVTAADYLVNFTMLSYDFHHQWVDGVYWTLAVEIKFYAMAAVAYFLFKERFWVALVIVAILGLIAQHINPGLAHRFLIPQYMPEFLAGIAAFFLVIARRKREGAILMAIALPLFVLNERFMSPLRFTPNLIGDAYILVLSAAMIALIAIAPGWRMGPLAFVGKISYSLYLLHDNIGVTIIAAMKQRGFQDGVAFCLAILVCGFLAWLSFLFVENPGRRAVMRLYARYRSSRASMPVAADLDAPRADVRSPAE